jgi:hypothetical protein
MIFCLLFGFSKAQNSHGKTDDAGRIALAAVVSDDIDGMTSSTQSYLRNKLNQITSKQGVGGSAINERFIITANVQVATKDVTATAPPMQAYTLEVTFYIGDGVDGKLFASTSMTFKGVGETETKAYKSALKNIKSSDSRFKSLIEEGKVKIIEYYNSQCDFILKEAEMLVSRNEYDVAIYKLVGIPEVCKECYDKAMEAVAPIYQKQIDYECETLLAEAQNAWNASLDGSAAKNASRHLIQIDPNSKCFSDAQNLTQKIASRIKELDQREWDFELKQQQDDVDLKAATINAVRDIGVAYGKNQPKTVTYNYRSWW